MTKFFVIGTVLLNAMAIGIGIPIVPELIVQLSGSSANAGATNGILVALVAAIQFLAAPLLGALSDCVGRRPILLVSTAGLACDYVIMATAKSVGWLYVGRLIAGASSATMSTVNAYVADTIPPTERTQMYGLITAAACSGGVIGQLLGGALAGVSLRTPFWIAGAVTLLAFVYGSFILRESLVPSRRRGFRWRGANPVGALVWLYSRRELRSLTTIYLLVASANVVFAVLFVLYAQFRYQWSFARTGAILAASNVVDIVVLSLVLGPMVKRFGERVTLFCGLVLNSLGYGCMGLAENEALFTLALIPLSFVMIAIPAVQSLMTRCVSESEQGQLQGNVASITSVPLALAPIVFGKLYSSTANASIGGSHPGEAFVVAALIVLAAAIGMATPRRVRHISADVSGR